MHHWYEPWQFFHQHQIRRQCTVNPAHLHICMCTRSEEEEGMHCLLRDLCGCLKREEDIWHYHVLLRAALNFSHPTPRRDTNSITFPCHFLLDHSLCLICTNFSATADSRCSFIRASISPQSPRGVNSRRPAGRQAGMDLLTPLILVAEWGKSSDGTYQV